MTEDKKNQPDEAEASILIPFKTIVKVVDPEIFLTVSLKLMAPVKEATVVLETPIIEYPNL